MAKTKPAATKLQEYSRKRHFDRTPEPTSGSERSNGTKAQRDRFVIQLHDASNEHFDFRLEAEGVLKSWAVPKGPSTDPRQKRLAVQTEDHPVDYIDFEGVIPAGEYGGGTVMVWDAGDYDNLTQRKGRDGSVPVADAVERGHVVVRLHGEKLRGAWVLQRLRRSDGKSWLLIKADDEDADARRKPTSTQRKSVQTGRTLHGIRSDEG